MQSVSLRRSDPTVDRLVRAAFPSYTGQRVEAIVTDRITFYGTQWDGGSRRSYKVVRLADLSTHAIETAPFLRPSALHENVYELPEGFVVVVHAQGRYDHIEIHSAAGNITPLLPPPNELSEDEEIVLVATRSLKSSYGGVSNYRFGEARNYTGITPERWDAAKASLIAKKLLNRAGAITVEGRNACPKLGLFDIQRRQMEALDRQRKAIAAV